MDHRSLGSHTPLDEVLTPILKIVLEHFIQQQLSKTHAKREKYT